MAALLQCLMLGTIIVELERRPLAVIRWWIGFCTTVRSHRIVAVCSIVLIVATAASPFLERPASQEGYSASQILWLSIALAAAAGIALLATTRRWRARIELPITVSLFLTALCFHLVIGTLILSTNAARAMAPTLLRNDSSRLALVILIATVVALITAWAISPGAIAAQAGCLRNESRLWRSLDGAFLILLAVLAIHWVPRL